MNNLALSSLPMYLLSTRTLRVSAYFILSLFLTLRSGAQNAVNITMTPSTVTTTENGTFSITVNADFVAAGTINALETYINFNPLDLEVISTPVVAPEAVTALPQVQLDFVDIATMNTNGRIAYGRNISSPTGHPSADFPFFTVTFRALRVPPGGVTTLSFNTTLPFQTFALEGPTNQTNLLL